MITSGLITNLLQGSCLEVPCQVDGMGIHPSYARGLPPHCATVNRGWIAGDESAMNAALEDGRRAAVQGVALGPLEPVQKQLRALTTEFTGMPHEV